MNSVYLPLCLCGTNLWATATCFTCKNISHPYNNRFITMRWHQRKQSNESKSKIGKQEFTILGLFKSQVLGAVSHVTLATPMQSKRNPRSSIYPATLKSVRSFVRIYQPWPQLCLSPHQIHIWKIYYVHFGYYQLHMYICGYGYYQVVVLIVFSRRQF